MLHHQSADLTLRPSILYRKPLDFARIYLRYPASIFNDLLDWLLLSHIALPVRNGRSVAQLPWRSMELSAAIAVLLDQRFRLVSRMPVLLAKISNLWS